MKANLFIISLLFISSFALKVVSDEWQQGVLYSKGSQVTFGGCNYIAKWRNSDHAPTFTRWSPWESTDCFSDCTNAETFDASVAYGRYTYVQNEHCCYFTSRWTQGQTPENGYPWNTVYCTGLNLPPSTPQVCNEYDSVLDDALGQVSQDRIGAGFIRGTNAITFNGNGEYVEFGNQKFGGATSFAFWARWDALNSFSRIIEFGNGQDSQVIVVCNEGSSTNFMWEIWTDTRYRFIVPDSIRIGQWNHWVVTVDDTKVLKVYQNGLLRQDTINNIRDSEGTIPDVTRTQNYLGKSTWSWDGWFKGAIADFRLYHKELSSSEVQDLLSCHCQGTYYNQNDYSIGVFRVDDGSAQGDAHDAPGFLNVQNTMEFDGDSDYIDLGPTNIGGDLTFSFWARWDVLYSWSRIIDFSRGDSTNNIVIANEGGSNNFVFEYWVYINNGGTSRYRHQVNNIIEEGVWAHWIVTLSGNQVLIYKNGQRQDVINSINPNQGDLLLRQEERQNSYIAKSAWAHDGWFKGGIANFQYFNYSIGDGQAQELYTRDLQSCNEYIIDN